MKICINLNKKDFKKGFKSFKIYQERYYFIALIMGFFLSCITMLNQNKIIIPEVIFIIIIIIAFVVKIMQLAKDIELKSNLFFDNNTNNDFILNYTFEDKFTVDRYIDFSMIIKDYNELNYCLSTNKLIIIVFDINKYSIIVKKQLKQEELNNILKILKDNSVKIIKSLI